MKALRNNSWVPVDLDKIKSLDGRLLFHCGPLGTGYYFCAQRGCKGGLRQLNLTYLSDDSVLVETEKATISDVPDECTYMKDINVFFGYWRYFTGAIIFSPKISS